MELISSHLISFHRISSHNLSFDLISFHHYPSHPTSSHQLSPHLLSSHPIPLHRHYTVIPRHLIHRSHVICISISLLSDLISPQLISSHEEILITNTNTAQQKTIRVEFQRYFTTNQEHCVARCLNTYLYFDAHFVWRASAIWPAVSQPRSLATTRRTRNEVKCDVGRRRKRIDYCTTSARPHCLIAPTPTPATQTCG